MDGPAELQRERAVARAGLEDLDGRRAAGGDVDVEEGHDGGCVEGVDLPLLLRQPVGSRQQGRDGTGRTEHARESPAAAPSSRIPRCLGKSRSTASRCWR